MDITLDSKLPQVGTTIFTVMSNLALKHQAINLGQGFPDFDPNPLLLQSVNQAMQSGHHQYPSMAGVECLREVIAAKIKARDHVSYDWQNEITITAGATQAIFTSVLAVVKSGDEVILLDPCYDSYAPSVSIAGGIAKRVALNTQTYAPDFEAIKNAINDKTRLIIINTPHNPSATIWTEAHMHALAQLLQDTQILVVADEVYEYMVFDQQQHRSVAQFETLRERSFVISSFGKTYHVTGWKIGYVAAPKALTAEFRKVHQFNVFTVNTPMQYAVADFISHYPDHEQLAGFYQNKRDFFRAGLAQTQFQLLPCAGSYFQCVDYSAYQPDMSDNDFCMWLIEKAGVVAIPLSAFGSHTPQQRRIRFCFAKKESTLQTALNRLKQLQ